MIKTIIFDFNGTVLDDRNLCLKLLNEMLDASKLEKISMERYLEVFDFPVIDYYKTLGLKTDKESFKALSEWFIQNYMNLYLKESMLYDGLIDVLKSLATDYKLILLSASEHNNLCKQAKALGLDDYFDDYAGTKSIEAASKLALIKDYFTKHNIKGEEAVFIGDTIHDYEVGKAVGAKVILIASGHQSKARLAATNAIIIDQIQELTKETIERT